jgi:4-hydroxy-3-polyprenylbenzoate decarboxylase
MTFADSNGKTIILGITGASGAVLAQTALRLLAADARVARVHLVISDAGYRLLGEELGISTRGAELPAHLVTASRAGGGSGPATTAGVDAGKIELMSNADIGASIASGSYPADAMCVIPCSMGALSAIASGASADLLSRAADVSLKEGRRLVLCVRDTPFSRIHLENMMRAQQAGAVIMPAIVSFYHQPKTIDDLVSQYVCRVLAQIGLPQPKQFTWQGGSAGSKAQSV